MLFTVWMFLHRYKDTKYIPFEEVDVEPSPVKLLPVEFSPELTSKIV